MSLTEKIHQLRKQHNMSQEQLAGKLGISRQAVSKWESGQSMPDTDKIIQLSKIFNEHQIIYLKMRIPAKQPLYQIIK